MATDVRNRVVENFSVFGSRQSVTPRATEPPNAEPAANIQDQTLGSGTGVLIYLGPFDKACVQFVAVGTSVVATAL